MRCLNCGAVSATGRCPASGRFHDYGRSPPVTPLAPAPPSDTERRWLDSVRGRTGGSTDWLRRLGEWK